MSTVFALGILVTVATVGVLSVLAGRMLGASGGISNYLVAALLFVVGLELLGAWPFRWAGLPRPETTRRGVAGAFLFGLAFGTALGPCTLAFLGPVVAVTVQTAGTRPVRAGSLMAAYALGHCGVLALAGAGGTASPARRVAERADRRPPPPRVRSARPGGRAVLGLHRSVGASPLPVWAHRKHRCRVRS